MNRFATAALAFILSGSTMAGEARLEKLWQTDATLKVPESVLYDSIRSVLYVSNIDGTEPWANDGQGSIAKVALDGSIVDAEWVSGLNGPKGMGSDGTYLYVTDIDDIVTIDINKAAIVDRVVVPSEGTINDLSVADDGTIYVTDSKFGRIFSYVDGEFTLLLDGLTALNGVLHSQGELLFVADGGLHVANDAGAYQTIATGMEGRVDGVERVADDAWLVSCWQGTVYYVTRNGDTALLLDGREQEISAADLGYDPINRIAYFPGFWKNYVAAYSLILD